LIASHYGKLCFWNRIIVSHIKISQSFFGICCWNIWAYFRFKNLKPLNTISKIKNK
jgi:hypothetical protein